MVLVYLYLVHFFVLSHMLRASGGAFNNPRDAQRARMVYSDLMAATACFRETAQVEGAQFERVTRTESANGL
jgi:hypothetical protein